MSHARSSIGTIDQQIKEMEKQIENAEHGMADHINAKHQYEKGRPDKRSTSWDRTGESGDSDPPPPGLDHMSPSTNNTSGNNPIQERSKKRSSR